MRILFLTAWFPHPPSNGSRLRVAQLLRALAPAHEVALLSFADRADADPTAPAVRALCRSVEVIPPVPFDPDTWRSRLAWLSPRPRSVVATFSPAMAAAVTRTVAAGGCDAVVASQLACAVYAPWFGGVPALFEEVELGVLHDQAVQSPRRWRATLMWAKHRRYLRDLLRQFRACTVVSERERTLLADVLGDRRAIHLLPNGVAAAEYPGDGAPVQPDTVVFTGSFRYRPNYEAMRWFVGVVWPRVLQVRPSARLLITGVHDDLPLPSAANVTRCGFVDDVRPLLATSWLAIAPIFTGGGTRLKILEALAAGTPVVATTKGAEGLDAIDGEHLLIADRPDAFAERVVTLLGDSALRAHLAHAGRGLVERRYDWRLLGPQFEALVREVARG